MDKCPFETHDIEIESSTEKREAVKNTYCKRFRNSVATTVLLDSDRVLLGSGKSLQL